MALKQFHDIEILGPDETEGVLLTSNVDKELVVSDNIRFQDSSLIGGLAQKSIVIGDISQNRVIVDNFTTNISRINEDTINEIKYSDRLTTNSFIINSSNLIGTSNSALLMQNTSNSWGSNLYSAGTTSFLKPPAAYSGKIVRINRNSGYITGLVKPGMRLRMQAFSSIGYLIKSVVEDTSYVTFELLTPITEIPLINVDMSVSVVNNVLTLTASNIGLVYITDSAVIMVRTLNRDYYFSLINVSIRTATLVVSSLYQNQGDLYIPTNEVLGLYCINPGSGVFNVNLGDMMGVVSNSVDNISFKKLTSIDDTLDGQLIDISASNVGVGSVDNSVKSFLNIFSGDYSNMDGTGNVVQVEGNSNIDLTATAKAFKVTVGTETYYIELKRMMIL